MGAIFDEGPFDPRGVRTPDRFLKIVLGEPLKCLITFAMALERNQIMKGTSNKGVSHFIVPFR